MSTLVNSASESDGSEVSENIYCIFLHVVEGIGLCPREGIGDSDGDWNKGKIILNASLNGVKFEVEGHSTESATIFNSNCIWECELGDIKRMKTDNRPVKLEIFLRPGRTENTPRKIIGSLLLPIRGLQTAATLRNMQFKMHWHKLGAISSEWRQNKPEIYLLLAVVKKTLIENGQFEVFIGKKKYLTNDLLSPQVSETALMLQSKSNIYVQLLEQVGLIQVGNNPDVDCDIFNVALTFKQVRNLLQLLERERAYPNSQSQVFVFTYDFLGSASNLEIFVSKCDCYTINEKITLSFKSSLRSLRDYFQRIFYVPINLYLNGIAIANYRLDFSKFLPDDDFFNNQTLWIKNGNFHFDRLHKILSPNAQKPSVDFIFSIQLLTSNAKKNNTECTVNETLKHITCDNKLVGNFTDLYYNMEFPQTNSFQKRLPNADNLTLSSCNLNNLELFDKHCNQSCTELFVAEEVNKSLKQFETDTKQKNLDQTTLNQTSIVSTEVVLNDDIIKTYNSVCIGTEGSEVLTNDAEDLTLKIVEELEEWKKQQMEHFLMELERKEIEYLAALQQQWELERSNLQQKLERRIAQCEELNTRLERTYNELKSNAEQKKINVEIADAIKNDIQKSYANKFIALETEIKRLQAEMYQKGNQVENQRVELQIENNKLETERMNLKASIEILETQLSELNRTHLSANELKKVLSDLRVQTEHFKEAEKSKNYYKEHWAKTTRDLHKLKLELLQQQDNSLRKNETDNFSICLKEIFTEEQDALNSDRSELKSVKEVMFASDTSSACDFEDEY